MGASEESDLYSERPSRLWQSTLVEDRPVGDVRERDHPVDVGKRAPSGKAKDASEIYVDTVSRVEWIEFPAVAVQTEL